MHIPTFFFIFILFLKNILLLLLYPKHVIKLLGYNLGCYIVLTLREPPCQATTTTRFLIVDASSAYNMLLGRPSLNAIKAIPSAYHMMIKFPTESGVGMVRGDQRVARECYSASVKQKLVDNVNVDELDMRDEVLTRPKPSEELEPVSLDDDLEHLAYIGSKLTEDLKSLLTQFLRQNRDVFA